MMMKSPSIVIDYGTMDIACFPIRLFYEIDIDFFTAL